jgi:hypothetical protein
VSQADSTDINIETEQMGYQLIDANDWWELISHTAFRDLIGQLDPSQHTGFSNRLPMKASGWISKQYSARGKIAPSLLLFNSMFHKVFTG